MIHSKKRDKKEKKAKVRVTVSSQSPPPKKIDDDITSHSHSIYIPPSMVCGEDECDILPNPTHTIGETRNIPSKTHAKVSRNTEELVTKKDLLEFKEDIVSALNKTDKEVVFFIVDGNIHLKILGRNITNFAIEFPIPVTTMSFDANYYHSSNRDKVKFQKITIGTDINNECVKFTLEKELESNSGYYHLYV